MLRTGWLLGIMATAASGFEVRVGQRQLFLDDHGIARIDSLTRTMHPLTKRGAVIRPDPDNLKQLTIQIRTAPAWDPLRKVWKLWDLSTPNDLHEKGLYCGGYWESRDGLHWTKPIVGQVEYRGSRENNFLYFLINGKHCRPDCVVYDPADGDANRRYKAAVGGVGFAVSPDGVTWKALDVAAVPSSDEYNLSLDLQDHLFILTVKHGGPHGRSVALSTSRDFVHWTKPELVFHADDVDQVLGRERIVNRFADSRLQRPEYNNPFQYNVDVYNMAIFRYEGLYIGMPAMYHETGKVPKEWKGFDGLVLSPYIRQCVRSYGDYTGFHHVQLACSRDLRQWRRLGDRRPFIDSSPLGAGAYDLQCIMPPSSPVVRGDELWFYYTGIKHYAFITSDSPDSGAVCLGVLRRDGFVSLDARQSEGILTTEPFVLSGDCVCVNADASRGTVKAEVLDPSGQPVAESVPVRGDQVRCVLEWSRGSAATFKGKPVSLRFRLQEASLYSYWVESGKPSS